MLAILSDLKIAPQDIDEYVVLRRRQVDPVLLEQPGCAGVTLLRPRDEKHSDDPTLLMFNFWADEALARAWGASSAHEEVGRMVRPLVRSISSRWYERVDEASAAVSESGTATVAAISFQQVGADRIRDYLAYRGNTLHPAIRNSDGLVGVWVLREISEPTRFAVYYRWTSDAAVGASLGQPFDLWEAGRISDFVDCPPSTEWYDIVGA